jgi:acyl-CoA reductase-like NAD-dependent aldehyde dehydrogenase
MTFPPQVEVVERHVADAVAKGARVLVGGGRLDRPGYWFAPTVLVDVDHTMDVMREETFGPVLPIMRTTSDEEAVALANDSRYGLNSSVWSADEDRAAELAARIEAGNVCINDCIVSYAVTGLPFGGVKESGIGRVHGAEGLREFTQVKSIMATRFRAPREPWWFPVPARLADLSIRTLRLRFGSTWRRRLGR